MPTFYELRNNGNNKVASSNYRSAVMSLATPGQASSGYVLLYQNSTYSNTHRPCAYLCEMDKVQWNGKVNKYHNSHN